MEKVHTHDHENVNYVVAIYVRKIFKNSAEILMIFIENIQTNVTASM